MEIKQYLQVIRKYLLYFIILFIVGLGAGYAFSIFQTPVYQASTKVLILQSLENSNVDIFNTSEQKQAQTFIELITTRSILETASVQLNTYINGKDIRVQQINEANLIEVTVQHSDPQMAALIANTLVEVFVEENEKLQNTRFLASEESLQAQIQQVEQQMRTLQTQSQEQIEANLEAQLVDVTHIISDLQNEIHLLEDEVIDLVYSKNPMWITNEAGFRIQATPTQTIAERKEIADKENRLNELKSLLASYQDVYVTLSFPSRDNTSLFTAETQQNQAAIDLYQQIYENLLSNYEAVRLSRVRDVSNIVQVESAVAPLDPISPRILINVFFGGVLALFLTAAVVFVIEFFDESLKNTEEISALFNAPILGYIGEMKYKNKKELGTLNPYIAQYPNSVNAEAFRTLRTNLEFANLDHPVQTILVTSPSRGEGKTTVACNLAASIAETGKNVILVDADLRVPRVHQELGLENQVGLSELLREAVTLEEAAQNIHLGCLYIITSGSLPPNPINVLNSEKMASLIEDFKEKADFVIIDGPPFILADASVLANRVDGNLIVICPNETNANAAILMVDQFENINANIIGLVINRHDNTPASYYHSLEGYTSESNK